MTSDEVTAFALQLPGAVEDHPFGFTPDVYKVGDRIFALLSADPDDPFVSLKCDPTLARALRQEYPAVTPGYHLNKRHWNSVALDGTIPKNEIEEMIRHSYDQVLLKLPKAVRQSLTTEISPSSDTSSSAT